MVRIQFLPAKPPKDVEMNLPSDRDSIARHEAGHTLAAYSLGMDILSVVIVECSVGMWCGKVTRITGEHDDPQMRSLIALIAGSLAHRGVARTPQIEPAGSLHGDWRTAHDYAQELANAKGVSKGSILLDATKRASKILGQGDGEVFKHFAQTLAECQTLSGVEAILLLQNLNAVVLSGTPAAGADDVLATVEALTKLCLRHSE